MKYIDADHLRAEIERRLSLLEGGTSHPEVVKRVEGVINGYNSILSLIDSLQQEPEVDLEKEIDRYCEPIQAWQVQEAPFTYLENCARHFYELGLKVQKGE